MSKRRASSVKSATKEMNRALQFGYSGEKEPRWLRPEDEEEQVVRKCGGNSVSGSWNGNSRSPEAGENMEGRRDRQHGYSLVSRRRCGDAKPRRRQGPGPWQAGERSSMA